MIQGPADLHCGPCHVPLSCASRQTPQFFPCPLLITNGRRWPCAETDEADAACMAGVRGSVSLVEVLDGAGAFRFWVAPKRRHAEGHPRVTFAFFGSAGSAVPKAWPPRSP